MVAVSGIFHSAAAVTAFGIGHAGLFAHKFFKAPETSTRKNSFFQHTSPNGPHLQLGVNEFCDDNLQVRFFPLRGILVLVTLLCTTAADAQILNVEKIRLDYPEDRVIF